MLEYTYRWNRDTRDMVAGYRQCTILLQAALQHFDGAFASDFQGYLAAGVTIPHTMFLVHLGAPETIHIRKERDERFDADSSSLAYWQERAAQEH
jgi:hypothetical protein